MYYVKQLLDLVSEKSAATNVTIHSHYNVVRIVEAIAKYSQT